MGCRRQSPQAPQSICQHRLLSAKQFLHMHRSRRGLCSERHNTGMKLAQVRSLLWCNFCVSPTVAALSACIPQLSSSWVQARIRICLPSGWHVTKVLSYQLILHSNSCHHPKALGTVLQSFAGGSASSLLCAATGQTSLLSVKQSSPMPSSRSLNLFTRIV